MSLVLCYYCLLLISIISLSVNIDAMVVSSATTACSQILHSSKLTEPGNFNGETFRRHHKSLIENISDTSIPILCQDSLLRKAKSVSSYFCQLFL